MQCSVVLTLEYWLLWFPVLWRFRRRWRWGWPLVAGDGGSRYRQQGRAEQVGWLTGAEEGRGNTVFIYTHSQWTVTSNSAHLAGQLLLKPGRYKRPGTHVLRLLLTPNKLWEGIKKNSSVKENTILTIFQCDLTGRKTKWEQRKSRSNRNSICFDTFAVNRELKRNLSFSLFHIWKTSFRVAITKEMIKNRLLIKPCLILYKPWAVWWSWFYVKENLIIDYW